jgi:hypothetical protein
MRPSAMTMMRSDARHGKPVRDEQNGGTGVSGRQPGHFDEPDTEPMLRLRIDGRGRFVEDYDERRGLRGPPRLLKHVPIMVSVYGHRHLPAGSGTFGHPVLSMWQTDIIYCGLDFVDYIDREFGRRGDRADDGWDLTPRSNSGATTGDPVGRLLWRARAPRVRPSRGPPVPLRFDLGHGSLPGR